MAVNGHRGISREKRGKGYVARIQVNKKDMWLGTFKTLDEAVKAREEAEEKYKNEIQRKLMIGKRFGKCVVLRETQSRETGGCIIYECRCDCGKIFETSSQCLNKGETLSCGCYNKEKNGYETLSKRFGFVEGTHLSNIKSNTVRKDNRTGVKGVTIDFKTGKYKASIRIQGKQIKLGTFDDLESAKNARKKAEDMYFKPIIDRNSETTSQ